METDPKDHTPDHRRDGTPPRAREHQEAARLAREDIRTDDDAVEQASEDSFPASDPPSYSGTTTASDR